MHALALPLAAQWSQCLARLGPFSCASGKTSNSFRRAAAATSLRWRGGFFFFLLSMKRLPAFALFFFFALHHAPFKKKKNFISLATRRCQRPPGQNQKISPPGFLVLQQVTRLTDLIRLYAVQLIYPTSLFFFFFFYSLSVKARACLYIKLYSRLCGKTILLLLQPLKSDAALSSLALLHCLYCL